MKHHRTALKSTWKTLLLLLLFPMHNKASAADGYQVKSTCLEDEHTIDNSPLMSPTTPVQLSCPPGKRILIQHAYFGAPAVAGTRRCRRVHGDCFRMDASLNRVCDGRNDCVTSVRSPGPIPASEICRQPVRPTYYQAVFDCVPSNGLHDVCRTGQLSGQRGHVISPYYPEAYPSGLNCSLTLSLPSATGAKIHQQRKIRITLLSLDLDCNSSLTVIGNVSSQSQTKIWHRCGVLRMQSIMLTDGPEFRVQLTTGPVAGVGHTGFWLKYEASPLFPELDEVASTTLETATTSSNHAVGSPVMVLLESVTSQNNGHRTDGSGSIYVDYRGGEASSGRFAGHGDSIVIFLVILVTSLLVLLSVVLATFVFRLFKAKGTATREYDDSHEILYTPSSTVVPLSLAGLPHSISGTCGFYDNRGSGGVGSGQQPLTSCPTSIVSSATLPSTRPRHNNANLFCKQQQQQHQQQQQLLLLPQPIRGFAADCCSASRRSAMAAPCTGASGNEYQDLGDFAAAETRRRSEGALYSETSRV